MRRTPMSRPYPSVLSLAALLVASVLLLLAAGCGGESQEQELADATATVVEKREAVEEAQAEVEARQQAVNEAQKALETAREELQNREQALAVAESNVGLKATDATLFRSVQRRLLDDEDLSDLAISAEAKAGTITLRGTVPDEEARAHAEEVARTTPGVLAVENRIEVESTPEKE
jgi:hyperosmotically inducible protein